MGDPGEEVHIEVGTEEVRTAEPEEITKEAGGGVKKPGEGKKLVPKKALYAGAVVGIILLSVLGYWAYIFVNSEVTEVAVGYEERDEVLMVGVHLSTTGKDYSGPAEVRIYEVVNDSEVQRFSTTIEMKRNDAVEPVHYTDFIMGNGLYRIKARVGEKEGSVDYSVNFIAENATIMKVSPEGDTSDHYLVQVSVLDREGNIAEPVRGVTVETTVEHNGQIETDTLTIPADSTTLTNRFQYPSQGKKSGWYAVDVVLTNTLARPDSPYRTLERNATVYLNRNPIPVINGPLSVRVNEEVTYDASGSYDPDGDNIENYTWYLIPGTDVNSTNVLAEGWGPVFTYTFNLPGTYTLLTYIRDDAGLDLIDATQDPPAPGQDGVKDTYVGIGEKVLTIEVTTL